MRRNHGIMVLRIVKSVASNTAWVKIWKGFATVHNKATRSFFAQCSTEFVPGFMIFKLSYFKPTNTENKVAIYWVTAGLFKSGILLIDARLARNKI